MNTLNESYPAQNNEIYLKKIMKFSIPFAVVNSKVVNFLICEAFRMLHMDVKEIIISKLRGFQPSSNYLGKFEFKPCTPNLSFLLRRLKSFDEADYKKKTQQLEAAVEFFTSKNLLCPGHKYKDRGFW